MPLAERQDTRRVARVEHARARDAGARPAIERVAQQADAVAREHRVVVEEEDTLRAAGERDGGAGVEPPGELP